MSIQKYTNKEYFGRKGLFGADLNIADIIYLNKSWGKSFSNCHKRKFLLSIKLVTFVICCEQLTLDNFCL
ncbi:MAG: hypothetical protein JJU02_05095 [Cryomorphaceae bacterium]|nr:hypothetical protein [Cryomorphaceae bacterium]